MSSILERHLFYYILTYASVLGFSYMALQILASIYMLDLCLRYLARLHYTLKVFPPVYGFSLELITRDIKTCLWSLLFYSLTSGDNVAYVGVVRSYEVRKTALFNDVKFCVVTGLIKYDTFIMV